MTTCITPFDQWDALNDVTHQNIPRNRTSEVAEILCVAGSLDRRVVIDMSAQFSWRRCYFINARISKLESNCNEANRQHLLNSFVHVFRKFSESN